MPLNTSFNHDVPAPAGFRTSHGWHMDDTIDAEQILMEGLKAWTGLDDAHRTEARQVFYATLFKACTDYLVRRMLDDGDAEAVRAEKEALRQQFQDRLQQSLREMPEGGSTWTRS